MFEEPDGPDSSSASQRDTSSRATDDRSQAPVNRWLGKGWEGFKSRYSQAVENDRQAALAREGDVPDRPTTPPGNRLLKKGWEGFKSRYSEVIENDRRARDSEHDGSSSTYDPPGNRLASRAGNWLVEKGKAAVEAARENVAAEFAERERERRERFGLPPLEQQSKQGSSTGKARADIEEVLPDQSDFDLYGSEFAGVEQKITKWRDGFETETEVSDSPQPAQVPYEPKPGNPFIQVMEEQRRQRPDPTRNLNNPFAELVAEEKKRERIAAKQKERTAARQGVGEQQQDMDKGNESDRDDSMSR
jgi:hypothetical protein